jgi:hypothetical protein
MARSSNDRVRETREATQGALVTESRGASLPPAPAPAGGRAAEARARRAVRDPRKQKIGRKKQKTGRRKQKVSGRSRMPFGLLSGSAGQPLSPNQR